MGFINFFKLLFRFLTFVHVRMKFPGELTISLLYFFWRGSTWDPKCFVIILKSRCHWNTVFSTSAIFCLQYRPSHAALYRQGDTLAQRIRLFRKCKIFRAKRKVLPGEINFPGLTSGAFFGRSLRESVNKLLREPLPSMDSRLWFWQGANRIAWQSRDCVPPERGSGQVYGSFLCVVE